METRSQAQHRPMKQIRIDMLAPQRMMVLLPRPPDGVRMGPIRSEITAGPMSDSFFMLVGIAKPIASGLIARFIYERVAQYDAKRVAINGREPVDRADFERTATKEIYNRKND